MTTSPRIPNAGQPNSGRLRFAILLIASSSLFWFAFAALNQSLSKSTGWHSWLFTTLCGVVVTAVVTLIVSRWFALGKSDITSHQKQLAPEPSQLSLERNERLAAVLETAVDGIITIDKHGLIDSLNQAACRMFGYTQKESIGQNINILMPHPYCDEHDGYLEAYLRTVASITVVCPLSPLGHWYLHNFLYPPSGRVERQRGEGCC